MIEEIANKIDHYAFEFSEILVFGLLFFILEQINPAERKTRFFKSDMKNELFLATVNIIVFIPLFAYLINEFTNLFIAPYIEKQLFAPQIQSLPLVLQIVIGAIVADFATYWRHRFTHFYMWSYHSVHHSAKQLTWISGLRLHPIDIFAGTLFTTFILYIFGFSGPGFLGAIIVIKFMNYFTHMNLDLKFPKPVRYILCSPAMHRWHHATVKDAYDKNFCGIFAFYDVIFGTYYHPEELPPNYGLSVHEEKNFPEFGYIGWLTYPFKRDWKIWKRRYKKKFVKSDTTLSK